MLFLDNAAPDSCCAERPLHIPTYPRLVSTAATVREKTWVQTEKPRARPTTITPRCACAARVKNYYTYQCRFQSSGAEWIKSRQSPAESGTLWVWPQQEGSQSRHCVVNCFKLLYTDSILAKLHGSDITIM